ncbi:MAG: DUF1178 family protein [Burkholderiaceae bacterium]
MKVFNLSCDREHVFEGWFGRSEDFERQVEDGLIQCPVCGSGGIRKLLSAPRINRNRGEAVAPGPAAGKPHAVAEPSAPPVELQKLWMQLARKVIESTEDVGDQFAEEARRIHYEETPARAIRGEATVREAADLAEEGIEVFAFPMPAALKNPVQ